jgi:hypothetical protein
MIASALQVEVAPLPLYGEYCGEYDGDVGEYDGEVLEFGEVCPDDDWLRCEFGDVGVYAGEAGLNKG